MLYVSLEGMGQANNIMLIYKTISYPKTVMMWHISLFCLSLCPWLSSAVLTVTDYLPCVFKTLCILCPCSDHRHLSTLLFVSHHSKTCPCLCSLSLDINWRWESLTPDASLQLGTLKAKTWHILYKGLKWFAEVLLIQLILLIATCNKYVKQLAAVPLPIQACETISKLYI